jgi:hypothetical protein
VASSQQLQQSARQNKLGSKHTRFEQTSQVVPKQNAARLAQPKASDASEDEVRSRLYLPY